MRKKTKSDKLSIAARKKSLAQVDSLIDKLEKIYPNAHCELDHRNAWELLIATILSAQCTDVRVNQITPLLFAKADTPEDMILLSIEEIQEIIRPCGLSPMKSKGIYGLSHILIDKHKGKVPKSFEALEELPAVGHKTASVVMAQAFGVPAFPVDTHIHRLLTRWGITNGKSVEQTERDAKSLFPEAIWNKLHVQIIYYGREYSPPRNPKAELDFITKTIGTKSALKELK